MAALARLQRSFGSSLLGATSLAPIAKPPVPGQFDDASPDPTVTKYDDLGRPRPAGSSSDSGGRSQNGNRRDRDRDRANDREGRASVKMDGDREKDRDRDRLVLCLESEYGRPSGWLVIPGFSKNEVADGKRGGVSGKDFSLVTARTAENSINTCSVDYLMPSVFFWLATSLPYLRPFPSTIVHYNTMILSLPPVRTMDDPPLHFFFIFFS